jgi:hypothetical protein
MEETPENNLNDAEKSQQVSDDQNFRFKPRFFALALAALTVFLPFFAVRHSEMFVMYFFWPLLWLFQHSIPHTFQPSPNWWILLMIITGFFYAYSVWWLVLVGLFKSSKHFKLALVVCALFSLGFFYSLETYKSQPDWTSRGLNPDRPGYKPSVVLLAGTVDYRFTDWETHWLRTGTATFEIRMRGHDRYYEKLWTGSSQTYNTFAFMQLALKNFYGTYNWSFAGSGHHGRGGSSEAPDEGLLPARRLWNGDEFIGATDPLVVSNKTQVEIFKNLKQVGSYKIPGEIVFNTGDHHELFVIRKVEFLPQPTAEWFDLVREKHFGRDQKLRATDLGEPVW